MKLPVTLLFAAVATSMLALAPLTSAKTRENRRLQAGKITKNEAQHLALKKYPGAKVQKCELNGAKNHGVWTVELLASGEQKPTQVKVDGRTGKLLP